MMTYHASVTNSSKRDFNKLHKRNIEARSLIIVAVEKH